jgi:outer membrane protein
MPTRRPSTSLRRLCAVASLGLLLAAPAAWAQSLTELYEAARGYDATYLSARALAESAQFRADQAAAALRPEVGLSASVNRRYIDSARGSGRSDGDQVGISATQPLFDRVAERTAEQARRALDAAQAQLQSAEQDLIVRLSQAYFDVLAAQDTLAFARASKTAITEQLAAAKRNFEVGTATITDTREAQARFDLATATEIAADNDLRTRRIALDTLVGRSGAAPKPLATPVQLPAPAPADAEAWVANTASHPLVRRARVNRDVAGLETEKARAQRLPNVDLVGSIGASRSGGSFATGVAGTSKNAGVGVQLSMPLYTGGLIQARIGETLKLEEQAAADLAAAERATAQATRQAFFGVQSGRAQVSALEAAEASSQLALEATQLGYRVGVRVNLDVLNAQTQLFQTRRDLAQARYNVILGGLRLRQAAGTLGPDDVNGVNALVAR